MQPNDERTAVLKHHAFLTLEYILKLNQLIQIEHAS